MKRVIKDRVTDFGLVLVGLLFFFVVVGGSRATTFSSSSSSFQGVNSFDVCVCLFVKLPNKNM